VEQRSGDDRHGACGTCGFSNLGQPRKRTAAVGAVDPRPLGQAKGIIMERFKIDDVRAFEMLRKLSQDTNTKLVDVAHRVIDTPAE
jgi:hypothetical protein